MKTLSPVCRFQRATKVPGDTVIAKTMWWYRCSLYYGYISCIIKMAKEDVMEQMVQKVERVQMAQMDTKDMKHVM